MCLRSGRFSAIPTLGQKCSVSGLQPFNTFGTFTLPKKLELFGLEIHMKNFDMVNSKPLVEDTRMAPTSINEICWDQNKTSISSPNQ